MTQYYIKDYAYLVKTTEDIAIPEHAHRQPLFGSLKTHAQHFKSQSSCKNDKISPEILHRIVTFWQIQPWQNKKT